jgi:hypothetical protein
MKNYAIKTTIFTAWESKRYQVQMRAATLRSAVQKATAEAIKSFEADYANPDGRTPRGFQCLILGINIGVRRSL